MKRMTLMLVLLACVATAGCATLRDAMTLHDLTFDFAGVSDARLAGIPIGPDASYASLGIADAARIGALLVAREAPFEAIVHVRATNPVVNRVAATLAGLDWTMFVDDRRVLAGGLAHSVVVRPGEAADLPLAVRFDLLTLGTRGARDLFDLALAIAGHGSLSKELRLELEPSIETAIGPIRYPGPIVIRRAPR